MAIGQRKVEHYGAGGNAAPRLNKRALARPARKTIRDDHQRKRREDHVLA
jgi:hypothetical protein